MQTIILKNKRRPPIGGVRLIKVDCSNCCSRLKGACFDLYWFNEQTGKYCLCGRHLKTDQWGEIEIKGLSPGRYLFVEVFPPPGYKIACSDCISFEICDRDTLDFPILTVGNCRACRPHRCKGCDWKH